MLPVVSVTTNLFVSIVSPPLRAVAPVTVAELDSAVAPVTPSVPAMAVLPVVSVTVNLFESMVSPPFRAVAPVTETAPVTPSVPAMAVLPVVSVTRNLFESMVKPPFSSVAWVMTALLSILVVVDDEIVVEPWLVMVIISSFEFLLATRLIDEGVSAALYPDVIEIEPFPSESSDFPT